MEPTPKLPAQDRFPTARGGKELRRHIAGGKLSLKQRILAKCYECMGNYADGKADCDMEDCPLYPIMPYGAIWKGREKGKTPPQFTKQARQKQKRGSIMPSISCEATGI